MAGVSKSGFAFFLGVLLSGCATIQGPSYSYNELIILNQSQAAVRDVAISSAETGGLFSCGNIAPRGICSNRFPARAYHGSPVRIDWAIGNGTRHSKTVELAPPASFVPELPMRAVLVIGARGGIEAYLQQEAPGPHL